MLKKFRLLWCLFIAAGAAMSARAPFLWAAEQPYKGKTVKIIVGFSTGGGMDTEGRLLAKHLERHVAGNPSILVQNMSGAGGIVAANWFEQQAKPDGLTLHYTSSNFINQQALGAEDLKFDLRRWGVVGTVFRGTSVAFARPEHLPRLTGPGEPLRIGVRLGDESWNGIFVWGAEFLKWNVRWVTGYPGSGELRVALQRDETQIYATAATRGLRELLSAGFKPFVQQGRLSTGGSFQPRPEFPAVPTFEELLGARRPTGVAWEAMTVWVGQDTAGRILNLPPNTPPDISREWQEAYGRLKQDKDFMAELKRVSGEEADLYLARDIEPVLRQMLTASPEVQGFAKAMMKKYLNR